MSQQTSVIGAKFLEPAGAGRMSHPDSSGPPDRTPVRIGEIWKNPITGERGTILELPWHNTEGRLIAELTACVGSRTPTVFALYEFARNQMSNVTRNWATTWRAIRD
jgi:hypothetical protein